MITAELTIIPVGTSSTSLSNYVAAAVLALDKRGIKYQISGMGTQIESENLEDLFKAIASAHEAVIKEGANRVSTSIKIDDRRDSNRGLADKVASVKKKL
ncbi:MAG: MTH1187 family thiamine-binding protein [Euryarchaeota archaeon]|nr:MTH1187 family thiamine-binding protein [Euryarchaeota archaeon]MBV1730540.1 MTH1187 family thiamine-binding protein [Methanobacterium sp.]MBU4547920.1 MTH1187 family thiamine-binding protein [Euryarchaeota archaeon]MBU4607094.1 MTH1187 family thiamine-binding protein [Euryarchaeota archaeon]MBV1755523.1 MTH1187 family thiamine-binding protein [Methanobacterium sp.]